jgi:hypothetical protein
VVVTVNRAGGAGQLAADPVTDVQTGGEKRVRMSLIPKEQPVGVYATLPCFGKRGCKLLKIKDTNPKKRAKRNKEAANYSNYVTCRSRLLVGEYRGCRVNRRSAVFS